MTESAQREPTNEDLWAQPPAASTPAYPGQQLAPLTTPAPAHVPVHLPGKQDKSQFVIAIISLGVAIPLTAISLPIGGLPALILCWVGLVLINLAYGWSRRQS